MGEGIRSTSIQGIRNSWSKGIRNSWNKGIRNSWIQVPRPPSAAVKKNNNKIKFGAPSAAVKALEK